MFICIIIIQKTNPNIIIVYEQNKIRLFFIYKKNSQKNGRRTKHCDGFLSLIINPKKQIYKNLIINDQERD
jgi:hypothetical protein